MSDAVAPASAEAPRERGWRRLVVALVAFLCIPFVPMLRAVVPLEQTLLLLVPALAACMLVGWWAGGRLSLALLWIAIAGWMLAAPATDGPRAYDAMARGWALLLAASFGTVCLAARGRTFFVRALAALGLAFGLAGVTLAVGGASADQPMRVMRAEYERRNAASIGALREFASSPGWREFVAERPAAAALADDSERQLRALPGVSTRAFPALLALESLMALGLAWALYHRLSRTRIGLPLAPLREFRFNDQLVWGLIVGVTTLVVPTLAGLRVPGTNLLLFFGALYALRGLGVLTWFLAPGRLVMVPLFLFALLAWPVLAAIAFGLGLGDTWLDWRSSRARPVT